MFGMSRMWLAVTRAVSGFAEEVTYYEYAMSLNPVAYWRLGDSVLPTAVDETGNYDGTYVNSPTLGTTGLVEGDVDTAVTFNGTTQYVINNTSNFRSSDTLGTILVLFNSSDADAGRFFSSSDEALSEDRFLVTITNTGLLGIYAETANVTTGTYTNTAYNDGKNHQVAFESDGASYKIYVDGLEDTDTSNLGIPSGEWLADIQNRDSIVIGAANSGGTPIKHFAGILDEVIYVNAVLTPEVHKNLYLLSQGISINPVSYNDVVRHLFPVAYWKLDETGAATTAVDEIGNYDGTYVNTPNLDSGSLILGDNETSATFDSTQLEYISTGLEPPLGANDRSFVFSLKGSTLPANSGADNGIFSYGTVTTGNKFVCRIEEVTTVGGLRIEFSGSSIITDMVVKDGNIHIIALVFSGTQAQDWKIYIDGIEQTARTVNSGTNTINTLTGQNLDIGRDALTADPNGDRYFTDALDEISVYDYALTQTDVTSLYNASRRVEFALTIDHTKVAEDLYDFPVLVNLDSISGITSLDTTKVFEALYSKAVEDDFTGTDGDLIDPYLWSAHSATAGSTYTLDIRNNKLRINVTSWTPTDYASIVQGTNFTLHGDFDISVDAYDLLSTSQLIYANLQIAGSGLNNCKIAILTGTGYDKIASYCGSSQVYYGSAVSSASLRVTREGAVYKTYYSLTIGGAWVLGQTATGSTGDITIKLSNVISSAQPTATITDFDNFKLNSGTVVWNEPQEEPLKLQTLYPASNFNKPLLVDDTFTGTNGDSPNSVLWSTEWDATIDVSPIQIIPDIQNNSLDFSITSDIGNGFIKSLFMLSGDFDIQVDFSLDAEPAGSYSHVLSVTDSLSSDWLASNNAQIGRYTVSDGPYRANITGGTATQGGTADLTGKLQLVRVGSSIDMNYWNGSSWTTLKTGTVNSNDMFVALGSRTWSDNTLNGNFDNFTVNSGTIVWPTYSNISNQDKQYINCEIDRWDSMNNQAQLWVKVPYISKDTDTVIELVADSSQIANPIYVGYTGSTAAQNVWSEYDAVYHLSTNGDDSTVNALHGTLEGGINSSNIVDFGIGKGMTFDGSAEYISLPDLTHGSALEFSASIFAISNDNINKQSLFQLDKVSSGYPFTTVNINNTASDDVLFHVAHNTTNQEFTESAIGVLNQHQYSFTTKENVALEVFLDGIDLNSTEVGLGDYNDGLGGYTIGADSAGTANFVNGKLKEFRFSKSLKSSGWIKTSYESISDTLITFTLKE